MAKSERITEKPTAALFPRQLLEMEKQGLITRGKRKLSKKLLDLPRPADSKGAILKILLQEREDGH